LQGVIGNRQIVVFDQLKDADLVIDRVYQGGRAGNTADDPLGKLLPIGNQGGFRMSGSPKRDSVKVAVLYTSGVELDWPDVLDPHTGVFTYFGDNRSPGRLLEETPRSGNLLLSAAFARAHGEQADRAKVPPFLLFDKPGGGRDVRFRGLLAPGSDRLSEEEDLVAVWRTTRGERFQNYRAHFTVLNVSVVTRAWLKQLLEGDSLGNESPLVWRAWVEGRSYSALVAPPTVIIRSREQQEPLPHDRNLLAVLYNHFVRDPYGFEQLAADLWAASERHVDKIDVTRPWRDGGRDATGDYLIGPPSDPVAVEFALEAKCYALGNGVGVRETSRLISRLRHRQFGVLITTSHVDTQAYKEIRDDGHPVVILAGRDVIDMLKRSGLDSIDALRKHLLDKYPQREAPT
jgi:hypothetical protein